MDFPHFKKNYVRLFLLPALIFSLGISAYAGFDDDPLSKSGQNYDRVRIVKVINPDKVLLENREKIKLIGLKAPETPKSIRYSRELSEKDIKRDSLSTSPAQLPDKEIDPTVDMITRSFQFTQRLLEGQFVRLEFDSQLKDDDFNTFAYVYLEDGTFVNAEILRQGYASLNIIVPNTRHAHTLREAYQDARKEKRGIHSE